MAKYVVKCDICESTFGVKTHNYITKIDVHFGKGKNKRQLAYNVKKNICDKCIMQFIEFMELWC